MVPKFQVTKSWADNTRHRAVPLRHRGFLVLKTKRRQDCGITPRPRGLIVQVRV